MSVRECIRTSRWVISHFIFEKRSKALRIEQKHLPEYPSCVFFPLSLLSGYPFTNFELIFSRQLAEIWRDFPFFSSQSIFPVSDRFVRSVFKFILQHVTPWKIVIWPIKFEPIYKTIKETKVEARIFRKPNALSKIFISTCIPKNKPTVRILIVLGRKLGPVVWWIRFRNTALRRRRSRNIASKSSFEAGW